MREAKWEPAPKSGSKGYTSAGRCPSGATAGQSQWVPSGSMTCKGASRRGFLWRELCVCVHARTHTHTHAQGMVQLLRFKGRYHRVDKWVFSFLMFFLSNFFPLPSNCSLTHQFKSVLINFPALGNLTQAPCHEPSHIPRARPVWIHWTLVPALHWVTGTLFYKTPHDLVPACLPSLIYWHVLFLLKNPPGWTFCCSNAPFF